MIVSPAVTAPVPLKLWLWRSYIKAALVPLLLIELGFVAIYWFTGQVVYDRPAAAFSRMSTDTLHDAANRAKASFLSSMSHELRTPLTAIIGYADLLEGSEGMKLDGKRIAQVPAISVAGWSLVRLIDAVLDYSGLDRQGPSLAARPVEVLPLIEAALATARPEAKRQGGQLRLEHDPRPLPKVMAEAEKLGRIFDEVLSNAVKYTGAGAAKGEAVVTVRLATEAPGWLAVSVADTNTGPGAGIGLAIAKRYADVLGCTLDFESKLGKGTTFTLRIPLAPV